MKYLNRLSLKTGSNRSRELLRLFSDNRYSEHQYIWSAFDSDPDAKRDFLYRLEQGQDRLQYLVLSDRLPSQDSRLWNIETREYQPKLRKGQRLRFLMRVNPVVKRRDDNGRQHRHDVVMDAKISAGWQTLQADERPDWYELVLNACHGWLDQRGATNGFELVPERLVADGYLRNRCHKRNQREPIFFTSVDLSGELLVTDVPRLETMLFEGLGPEKGFGCGLVLIKVVPNVAAS